MENKNRKIKIKLFKSTIIFGASLATAILSTKEGIMTSVANKLNINEEALKAITLGSSIILTLGTIHNINKEYSKKKEIQCK